MIYSGAVGELLVGGQEMMMMQSVRPLKFKELFEQKATVRGA